MQPIQLPRAFAPVEPQARSVQADVGGRPIGWAPPLGPGDPGHGVEHGTRASDRGEPLFPNSVECIRLM